MLHLIAAEKINEDEVSFETDRSLFIGRGRTTANPNALNGNRALSDSEGPVLDPIVSIRCTVTIEPKEKAKVNFITGIAETRDLALRLIEKYHDPGLTDRVHNLAWTHNEMIMQQLNITETDIQLYLRLASAVIYPSSNWRAPTSTLLSNQSGQSALWAYGISGDIPIVLLKIRDRSYIDLARQLLKAHAYWHIMGLAVDLVIWNGDSTGYRQQLQDDIMGLISVSTDPLVRDQPGRIFVIHGDEISEATGILLQSAACAVFSDDRGTFDEQLDRKNRLYATVPLLNPEKALRIENRSADKVVGPGSDILQRPCRFHKGRPGVHNQDRSGTGDAGSLVECYSKPALWDGDLRMRRSLYLGRELPAVPSQPLV